MKNSFYFILLFLMISCKEESKKVIKTSKIAIVENDLFKKNRFYYTPIFISEYTVFEDVWVKNNFDTFKSGSNFKSEKKEEFELLYVYNSDEKYVIFNQIIQEKDSIKHIILDKIILPELNGNGWSLGVTKKEDLLELDTKNLISEAIISILEEKKGSKTINQKIDSVSKSSEKIESFGVINIRNPQKVVKAWYANTESKMIEILK